MNIRVVIADDQALIREGFAVLLNAQPDIDVVGEAENGEDALGKVEELAPDVVLMDIRMPGVDGLEATRRIVAAGSETRIVVLTTFDSDEYVYEALRAGASGFLLKDTSGRHLAEAVRTVAAGGAMLAPTVTKRLLSEFSGRAAPRAPRIHRLEALTEREREVLCLIAQGMSNAELAAHLVVAEQTVKTHVSRVLAKLQLRDRTQAVVYAYETGLVQPGR